MQISISILATELTNLKATLQKLDSQIVDYIHLDIMDGHFVPQLSFGESFAKEIASATNIPLDVHLMVTRPEQEVPKYFSLKPRFITFHIESTHSAVRLAQSIRAEGIACGVSINPGTAVELLEPLLDEIDLILLMSVEPGYYGQKFLPSSIAKARKVKDLMGDRNIILEVDGGIDLQNISDFQKAGVGIAVSGGTCFRTANVNANVQELKASCT